MQPGTRETVLMVKALALHAANFSLISSNMYDLPSIAGVVPENGQA